MRIEGHQSHGLPNQRRVDGEHAKQAIEKSSPTREQKLAAKAHLSSFRTKLMDQLQKVPEVRSKEVQRVAAQVRLGVYSTNEAAQNTAAAILASPERLT